MKPDRHVQIGERDLADQLPDLARRMRTIAHDRRNWFRPPRDVYGWDEHLPEVPITGPEALRLPDAPTPTVRRQPDGWVPISLLRADDAGGGAVDPSGDGEPWTYVPDLAPYLIHRYLLVEHQTRVVFTYTVDVPPGSGPQRHLSMQIIVPGQLTQGQIVGHEQELLGQHEGVVLTFFPAAALGVAIKSAIRVGDAWPVVDPAKPVELRAASWKTPVTFDFALDHELENVPGPGPKRKVQLYGPRGEAL